MGRKTWESRVWIWGLALFLITSLLVSPAFTQKKTTEKKIRVDKMKRLLELTAMQVKTISGEGNVVTVTYGKPHKKEIKFWAKQPNKMRVEYTYPPQMKGALVITDGKTLWRYLPALKGAFAMSIEGGDKKSKTLDKELGTIGQLVSRASDVNDFWSKNDLKVLEEGKVGKRKTYVIELIPKEKEAGALQSRQKLWIDKETGLTLKIEFRVLDLVETITFPFSKLKINQNMPESLFVYKGKMIER